MNITLLPSINPPDYQGYARAAVEEGVPAATIQAALNSRFESRQLGMYAGKLASAMRSEFGGHDEKPG